MATVIPTKIRQLSELKNLISTPDPEATQTTFDQHNVETNCFNIFEAFRDAHQGTDPTAMPALLQREKTLNFLHRGLTHLSGDYSCLDASRPWLIYWILHALELLGEVVSGELRTKIIGFLAKCQNKTGGFGGGPGQLSHLAPTYAAVNALAILSDEEAYEILDREKLAEWLDSLRNENGSFLMHQDGEIDIRGVYCALSIAKLTNIFSGDLFKNTGEWVLRCQTYEGGFGSSPGNEAHGGYTFCGLAALIFLEKERLCNVDKLLKWTSFKQMKVEGGFQGRTNKLVDACYSFWQGGVFPLLHGLLSEDGHDTALPDSKWLFDQHALQEYLLLCCQDKRGGLVDKPGKFRDYYHTSYALSGLSVAQNFNWSGRKEPNTRVFGPAENILAETHPLFNVCTDSALHATEYFSNLKVPSVAKH